MRKDDVQTGATYVAKVSGKIARVRIDRQGEFGGWDATNVATGREVHIKSAQRLRRRVRDGVVKVGGGPDACATIGCERPAAIEYLGRKRCMDCYKDEFVASDDVTETNNAEDTTMATKKDGSKKGTKAPKTPKAATRKAARNPEAAAGTKRVSALDAAAEVLQSKGKPMHSQELIAAMAEQGLWSSPNGKTPHATLYAAILREINTKGSNARFRKVERGAFEYAGGGK